MAALLDGRHRWGDVQTDGATRSRTCLACGRVVTWETFIPDIFLDEALAALNAPGLGALLGSAPRSFIPDAVTDEIIAAVTSDPILTRLGFRRDSARLGSGPSGARSAEAEGSARLGLDRVDPVQAPPSPSFGIRDVERP